VCCGACLPVTYTAQGKPPSPRLSSSTSLPWIYIHTHMRTIRQMPTPCPAHRPAPPLTLCAAFSLCRSSSPPSDPSISDAAPWVVVGRGPVLSRDPEAGLCVSTLGPSVWLLLVVGGGGAAADAMGAAARPVIVGLSGVGPADTSAERSVAGLVEASLGLGPWVGLCGRLPRLTPLPEGGPGDAD
jgi:hypothetical protein